MSLLALQEDFHLWLTAEADGLGARLARASAPGLAVHLNNYRGQLIGCLKTSYPALYAWLGQSSFEAAAATHIDRSPPRDWTLDAYALGFPGTLTTLFPNDPEVTELALLERQLDLAFIGPDAAPIDFGVLGDVDWDRAVLDLVPTFVTRVFATNACKPDIRPYLVLHPLVHVGLGVLVRPRASLLDHRNDLALVLDGGSIKVGQEGPACLRFGHVTLFLARISMLSAPVNPNIIHLLSERDLLVIHKIKSLVSMSVPYFYFCHGCSRAILFFKTIV